MLRISKRQRIYFLSYTPIQTKQNIIFSDECTWVPEKILLPDCYDLIEAYLKEARDRVSGEVKREFEKEMQQQKKKAKKGRKGKNKK